MYCWLAVIANEQQVIFMRSRQKQLRKSNKQQLGAESLLNRKIVSPQKLKILVLAGNELLSQHLQFLQKCINLIKLDLSHNHITKLPQKISFQNLTKLEVLQLHHNKLGGIDAIQCIFQCPVLTYLTYHHNPMESLTKNQHTVINMIPSLKLLNNRIVYIEERSENLICERPMTFVDGELFENWKSTQNSEAYYLKVLNMQLQYIDNVWTFNNPIIFIQRAWRHFLPERYNISSKSSLSRTIRSKMTSRKGRTTSKLNHQKETLPSHPLKTYFEEWKKFSTGLKSVKNALKHVKVDGSIKDKTYLLQPLPEYFRILRNMRVRDPLLKMVKHIRHKIYEKRMAYVFMTSLRMKKILFESDHSFYHISGMSKCNKLYYNRNQQHLIDNFLAIIAERLNKRQVIYNKSSFQVNRQYNAIRLVDPESYLNKYTSKQLFYSFCSLMWPSMKVVTVNRKKVPSKFKAGIIGIRQLSYIRNRDKVVSKTEYKKSVEVYKRLQKFAQNEYQQSMWYFQCNDAQVMKNLIRMVYYHNTKALRFQVRTKRSEMLSLLESYEQPFIFYVESILKRTCAAVAIQKTWRRYISNKNQKESIYSKMKKNRAALHIQHFYRECLYKHRAFFTNKLYNDLSLIKTATILYPLQLYLNITLIYNSSNRGKLFKNIKLTKKKDLGFGVNQQFYRSIFHPSIRTAYFNNHPLGMENYEEQIDVHQLLHCNSEIKMVNRGNQKFIAFTYANKAIASMVASLIALFTYQLWGKYYVFPLTRENLELWHCRIQQYRKIHIISKVIKSFVENNEYILKQIKEAGVFLSKATDNFPKKMQEYSVSVDFYQKRYHNFPLKHNEHLIYRFVNVDQLLSAPLQMLNVKIQLQNKAKAIISTNNHQEEKRVISENTSNKQIKDPKKENPLNITTIDKAKFSFFDQSDKNLKSNTQTAKSQKSQLQQFSKTAFLAQQNKRQKVMKFYKQQILKREAQKQVKQISLAALRDKAKQQKTMNMTMKNMKDIQRTEYLRAKVNKVKEFKSRANSTKRDEQCDFLQQNNFVMEQQLKMVIMRNKMKDLQARKQESLASRKMSTGDRQSQVRTIQSRKSSKQRVKVEQQEIINNSNFQTNVIGDEGSVINAKKKGKKSRANSIGAYIRDPSFVHGVFPQEYYPIQSRSTSFYFPPVV